MVIWINGPFINFTYHSSNIYVDDVIIRRKWPFVCLALLDKLLQRFKRGSRTFLILNNPKVK